MPNSLEGKCAIITGAARGIGFAAAQIFAAQGAQLLLNDRDAGPVEEAVAAIRHSGGMACALPGDVTDDQFPARLLESSMDLFGIPDILVNNAGFTWDGVLHKITDVQWQKIIDVHLTGPFRILRAVGGAMRETAKREIEQRGRAAARKIVNVSSTSGTRGNFGQANYAAAKAGIVGLTKTLAREWGPFNIQCNTAAFGLIETRLTEPKETGQQIQAEAENIRLGVPARIRDAALASIPMGRFGTAHEAAGVILFLASPLSDYVSGQVIEATGGA